MKNPFHATPLHASNRPAKAPGDCEAPPEDSQYRELYRFIAWLVATSVPMTTLVVLMGVLSGSLTIIAITMDYGLSLGLNIMSLFTLSVVLRNNRFQHPYGAGKLENFSAFLYGLLIIPLAFGVLAAAAKRAISFPEAIHLAFTLPFFLAVVRLAVFAVWITRLGKKYPRHSPLMQAYHADYRMSLVYESAIFITLLAGCFLAGRNAMNIAIGIDITVASLIAMYYLVIASRLIRRNFRALADLPLAEKYQYSILRSLAKEYDAFDGLGAFYTRRIGNTPLIQIELQFSGETPLKEIDGLRRRMEQRLCRESGVVIFQLIPLCLEASAPPRAPDEAQPKQADK